MKELNKHRLSPSSNMDAINTLCEMIEQAFGILTGACFETMEGVSTMEAYLFILYGTWRCV
jgi:hypothetical protein